MPMHSTSPPTCGGHSARRSPFVEPHARVLNWVLAWGCTASGLGWAGGCNPSGRPKREGCSRSTPRSLPSEGQYGHRTKGHGTAGQGRMPARRRHADTDRVSARAPSRLRIIRPRCYAVVRVPWSVWLCDHRLRPSVSATVDRSCQSTYEGQLVAGSWWPPIPGFHIPAPPVLAGTVATRRS